MSIDQHPTPPLLQAIGLRKAFGRTEALRGATLAVEAGEIVAITGASGSGKSTLLHTLAGLIRPEAGTVVYDGQRLDALSERDRTLLRRREFGIVLQFGQLVPELTAVQNVALPLLLGRHDRTASTTAARAWLDEVGAGELADALPGELSGGETQRVSIARALVTGPKVIFADEPTGALDTVSSEQVLRVLLDAAGSTGATVILVTHDNRVAAQAGREILLQDGAVPSSVTT